MDHIKTGKPDCEHCDGTGVRIVQDGEDDYNSEPCFCTEEYEK